LLVFGAFWELPSSDETVRALRAKHKLCSGAAGSWWNRDRNNILQDLNYPLLQPHPPPAQPLRAPVRSHVHISCCLLYGTRVRAKAAVFNAFSSPRLCRRALWRACRVEQ
jgi:hypothetical protein